MTSAIVWHTGDVPDRLLLALTRLAVAMGAVVFPELAPADLLMLALIVLLPLAGLVHVEPALGLRLSMMLVAAAAALLGATTASRSSSPSPTRGFRSTSTSRPSSSPASSPSGRERTPAWFSTPIFAPPWLRPWWVALAISICYPVPAK